MKRVALILIGIIFSMPCKSGERLVHFTSSDDRDLYDALYVNSFLKPDFDVFEKAMIGYRRLRLQGMLSDKHLLTIIDFRKSSTEKRLWIIDLQKKEILLHTLVAHGRNSGNLYATRFSNRSESHQSSLGFYITGETYVGRHGLSLKLYGVEKGVNDLAEKRAIVIHPADYVSEAFIQSTGRLGRSYGCPAVAPEEANDIINTIKSRTCLFIYYPDPAYIQMSEFNQYVGEDVLALRK